MLPFMGSRAHRLRHIDDAALRAAVEQAMVDWLTTEKPSEQQTATAARYLEELERRHRRGLTRRCSCETCFAWVHDLWS